jgi:hypothetical protein
MAEDEKKPAAPPPDNVTSGQSDGAKKGKGNCGRFQQKAPGSAFEGKCDGLKGHVYDCASAAKAADMYTKTTREIAEYVGREYKYSAILVRGIETLVEPVVPPPDELPDGASALDRRMWEKRIDKIIEQEERLKDITSRAYALVWGQCSEALREKVKAHKDYAKAHEKGSVIELLKVVKTEMFTFQTQKYGPQAMHEAKRRFYMLRQEKYISVQQYYETFVNTVEVIEHCGGDIGVDRSLVTEMLGGHDRSIASSSILVDAEQKAKDKYLACAFLLGSDKTRYGRLIEDLENSFTQGVDKFPKTMVDAYNLLVNWKQNPMNYMRVVDSSTDGAMFVTDGGDDDAGFTGKCWSCKQTGHRKNQCPLRAEDTSNPQASKGTQLLMSSLDDITDEHSIGGDGFMFAHLNTDGFLINQSNGNENLREWILLDNQSTVNVFCNPNLVKNVRTAEKPLKLKCNAGTVSINKVADLPGYPESVWFHEKGIANVLSLARVAKLYPVTFDNMEGFTIHKKDGSKHVFRESERGLFYLDTSIKKQAETMLVMTVQDQMAKYSQRDVQRANLARKLQKTIGHPSIKQFMKIVKENQLPNCPIGTDDILVAEDIFGPSVSGLKGKTVRSTPMAVSDTYEPLPPGIVEKYQSVTLAFDLMYVNKVIFLVTFSRHIRFGTAERINSRREEDVTSGLKSIVKLYKSRGFKVDVFLGDGEFEPLRESIHELGGQLNVTSNDEHVGDVERYIRTVKEQARASFHSTPFKKLPIIMIQHLVGGSVFWLNAFPSDGGITGMSPRAIMTGKTLDYTKHCRLMFGAYAQVHEEHNNSMEARTTGAIALRPTGNDQGGYYFMSLTTGRLLN